MIRVTETAQLPELGPAWVTVPGMAEWLYLQSGECMRWHPSLKLFRQLQSNGWSPLIEPIVRKVGRLATP